MHARTKLVIAAAIASVGAGAWSCSSSSSNTTPGEEGGTDSGLDGSGSSSGGSSSGGGSSGGSSSGGTSEGGADGGDAGPGGIKHIFYIMMENHAYSEIVGNTADAPYINTLATTRTASPRITTASPTRACRTTSPRSPATTRGSSTTARPA